MGQSKFSYGLTVWFISIENGGKQKSKNTLRVEINQFCDDQRDTMSSSYAIDKIRGVKLPHQLLEKVGVELLGIIFLNTELNKPHFLCDEMIFMHRSLQIKQNIFSKGLFSCVCSGIIYTKNIKKNRRKSHF